MASRLALADTLPESVQQLVREGKIAASLAMRYLVPVARISLEHCRRMAQAFAEQGWTTRQAGESTKLGVAATAWCANACFSRRSYSAKRSSNQTPSTSN